MSCFYYLACDHCKKRVDFVGRWVGRVGWLADSPDQVLKFMDNHMNCIDKVKIVSEHDKELHYRDEFPLDGDDDDEEAGR
jgi:hypothetical protein